MTRKFPLREKDEFIQLIQLLKATGIAESGAIAQEMVVYGEVMVNGEVDYRKRAKLKKGDIIEIFQEKIEIV
ncbi:MAG: RNA-binding S4 domain-containing protein [Bacteroidales bacterium]|nr:RNA-binding S4 domain-containing protein [Bacteroidales bacterium]